jgi:hypothetical protein
VRKVQDWNLENLRISTERIPGTLYSLDFVMVKFVGVDVARHWSRASQGGLPERFPIRLTVEGAQPMPESGQARLG